MGLTCEVSSRRVAVQVGLDTICEADVAIRCGEPLGKLATRYTDPLIALKVPSPSTRVVDAGLKLDGDFSLTSLRHRVIVRLDTPTIIHHERGLDGLIATRIVPTGTCSLSRQASS